MLPWRVWGGGGKVTVILVILVIGMGKDKLPMTLVYSYVYISCRRVYMSSLCVNSAERQTCFKLPLILSGVTFNLKVPKCEIFDRSEFPDFYTIKSRREGDFGIKIKKI